MITKYFSAALILFLAFSSCNKKTKEEIKPTITEQKLPIKVKKVTYKELKPYLEKKDAKTYVVNFWATWCGPCVKELPYFEKIKKEYASKNVEVILVSLDFPKKVEKKLIPFIEKNNLQSEVLLLDDANEDFWIKAIDSSWSGAIPATIIYNKDNRKFFEKSFDYETLEKQVQAFIN